MANENAKRDENRVTTILGVTDDANQEIRQLRVDPTSKRLKVSAVISGGGGGGTLYHTVSTIFETAGRFTSSGTGSATYGPNGLTQATSATTTRFIQTRISQIGSGNGKYFNNSLIWSCYLTPSTLPTTGSS
jgi:hypothetical protein